MLPKACLTSHSKMSGSRWVITPSWLSGSWRSFLYSFVYSFHLFLICSASVRSILFPFFIVLIVAWNIPLASLIFLKRSLDFAILLVFYSQYMNCELPDVQVGFIKGRGCRDQIANIHWIIVKAWEFQKNICFIDYAKALDCVDHNKLWKILQEMGIPDHLTCLMRNLYAGQEATEMDMEQWTGSK